MICMTRKGKIARLPQSIREQINRRLQNGEEGKHIAEWLNALPEVIAVLAAEFDGQRINDMNLSNWKLGGYRDWEAQQEALEAVRRFGGDAAELSQAAGGQLADQLAVCLTARIAVALQRPLPTGMIPPHNCNGCVSCARTSWRCEKAITTRNGCGSSAKSWIWT